MEKYGSKSKCRNITLNIIRFLSDEIRGDEGNMREVKKGKDRKERKE